jgi:hypothetical protein
MNCAMSSRVTFVSSMEAEMPGSRLRSEMDMRRGERAGREGERLPSAWAWDWEEVRTGMGAEVRDGAGEEPPVSSKKGRGDEWSGDGMGVLAGDCIVVLGMGMSATSKDWVVGVASIDWGRWRVGCCCGLDSSCSMMPCNDRPRCMGTGKGE